jgi:hypothetical protein
MALPMGWRHRTKRTGQGDRLYAALPVLHMQVAIRAPLEMIEVFA